VLNKSNSAEWLAGWKFAAGRVMFRGVCPAGLTAISATFANASEIYTTLRARQYGRTETDAWRAGYVAALSAAVGVL
jgi:hypothetical protein